MDRLRGFQFGKRKLGGWREQSMYFQVTTIILLMFVPYSVACIAGLYQALKLYGWRLDQVIDKSLANSVEDNVHVIMNSTKAQTTTYFQTQVATIKSTTSIFETLIGNGWGGLTDSQIVHPLEWDNDLPIPS